MGILQRWAVASAGDREPENSGVRKSKGRSCLLLSEIATIILPQINFSPIVHRVLQYKVNISLGFNITDKTFPFFLSLSLTIDQHLPLLPCSGYIIVQNYKQQNSVR